MANIFPCPSCGGELRYDIKDKKLKCLSCDESFEADTYKSKFMDEGENAVKFPVYRCKNCAGEIVGNDIDSMEFCPYCGTQIVLSEKFSETGAPKFIIPFSISKEDCKKEYKNMTSNVAFLPDELKSEEGLNKFVGLYTPYWLFNYEAKINIKTSGIKRYTKGSYDYTEKAKLSIDVDYDNLIVSYDASDTLDDTISHKVEPFYLNHAIEFNPNYMAGFYAENSNVKSDGYKHFADKKSDEMLVGEIKGSSPEGFTPLINEDDEYKLLEKKAYKGVEGAYLPLWFLTTKNKDRVAYTIVNGQSGRMYSELPVDIKKYIGASLIASLIFAFIFIFIIGSIPIKSIATIGILFSIIMIALTSYQSKKIYEKENHINDIGYQLTKKENKENMEKPHRKVIAAIFFSILGGISALALKILNPADDIFYYGVLMFIFVMLLLSILTMAKDYNRLATNPLPQFNKTGGGLDGK